ncbi:lipopolysaccharide biosynthesis protein [Burkholderia cepacia]|uniref:lipopolysaccharide biosynthesis protein n=1 Tax=Burkholderia cepacia TaxID=292 RepID=UPI003EE32939
MARRRAGLAAGYAISLIGGVGSLALYAHTLDAPDYGRLAVYLAAVEAFQGVLFQWHRMALVKFWAAREHGELASFLATSEWTGAGLAGAIALAVLTANGLGAPMPAEWLAAIALGLAKSAALYAQEIARATGAVARYACGAILQTAGVAIAGTFAYRATHSVGAMLVVSSIAFAATAIVVGWRAHRLSAGGRFRTVDLADMLRYGLPLIPVFVATAALTRLDRPILAQFESTETVGVYAAAATLVANVVTAACLLVVTPAYPWLLREKEHRAEADYRRLHARVGTLMLAGMLGLSATLYGARDAIFPLLLGQTLGHAAMPLVLPLLGIAIVNAFRTHFLDQAYHLFSRTRALMAINVATLGVAVVTLYGGARLGGLPGLLAGLAIAHGVSMCLSAALARSFVDLRRLFREAGLLAGIAAAACAAGTLAGIANAPGGLGKPWQSLLAGLSAAIVFAIGLYLFNVGKCRSLLSRGHEHNH